MFPDIKSIPGLKNISDEDMATKGADIWKQLDYLASREPKKYRELIAKAAEELKKDEKPSRKPQIEPGACLKVKGTRVNGTATHYINVCSSKQAKKPEDSDDGMVPIVMSEQRTGVDTKTNRKFNVYDTVVHPLVLDKANDSSWYKSELIDLCLSSVEETFSIKLSKSDYENVGKVYQNPFGWDDDGKPVQGFVAPEDEKKADDKDDFLSTPTPESLLSSLHNMNVKDQADSPKMELKLKPEIPKEKLKVPRVLIEEISSSTESSLPLPSSSLSEAESVGAEEPIVEDDKSLEDLKEGKDLEANNEDRSDFEPQYTTHLTESSWTVHIDLPNISSISEISLTLTDNAIHLTGKKCKLFLEVSVKNVVLDNGEAKFVKSKKILVLKFPRIL